MNTRHLLALLVSIALIAGCDRDATESAAETADTTAGDMALPATTASDEARRHYRAGWNDFENSRFVTAYGHFQQAAAADPDFAMAHLMSALSAVSTESFVANLRKASAAKAGATRGEQLMIEAFERALANDSAGQIAKLQEVTGLHPDSPRAWTALGNAYANENRTADSRAAYEKAIGIDAGFVPGHINLGVSFLSQEPKDYAVAEMHFKHAVELTPNEPNPHDLLGDVHRAQNNFEAAYDDYTRAAELAPELGSALQQRGHVNSFLGNYDEARADYARSAELEDERGTNIGGFYRVFGAYVNLHEGDLAAAVDELREIADTADEMYTEGVLDLKANALQSAALIATEAGDAETASALIADAAAVMRQQSDEVGTAEFRDANEATIAYMEGRLAARMGDADGAKAKAEAFKAAAASSSSPRRLERMHEIMGIADFYQGNYASAAEHLSQGNHLNNMYTKYYLARAHEEAGNADAAAQLYDELAVWNFNGAGYAMFRKDILERAGSG